MCLKNKNKIEHFDIKLDLSAPKEDAHWVQELNVYFSEVQSYFIFKSALQSCKPSKLGGMAAFITMYEWVNYNCKSSHFIADLFYLVKFRVNV